MGVLNTLRDNNLPELTVVVPTYREAANLPELARRIYEAVKEAGISTEIIVVDDNSQDGTDKVCKELSADYPLRLITRSSERGLARAVITELENHEVRMYSSWMLICPILPKTFLDSYSTFERTPIL